MVRRTYRVSNALQTRKSPVTLPRVVGKVGRNDPCPCGSGTKYKDCHWSQGEAFLEKLARRQAKDALKEAGVPWYRRLLR